MIRSLALLSLVSLLTFPLAAQEQDAEGCKDSTVLSRMKGCVIDSCDKKDFDRAGIRTGASEEQMQSVEGEVEIVNYRCAGNVSFLSIARNAENALKGAGFKTIYSGAGLNEAPAYSARKGGVWVDVQTQDNGGQVYTATVVHTKEMAQEMVASAEAMEADITKTGSCSIYGIVFDIGKSAIKQGSEECLTEVAKLPKKNGSWKMQVEGHTDHVGGRDANIKLSQARAEAVRSWLMSHGVEGTRLVAKGLGDTKPITANTTEEGRAKNRRVALVKM